MPEWAIVLVGVAGGVIAALVGAAFTAWLQERREWQRHGADAITKLRILLTDADPQGVLFGAGSDPERARRNGADLWRRWREVREPFLTFALVSRPAIQQAAEQAATHVALSIQATRNAIDEIERGEADSRKAARHVAQEQYKQAKECVDDVDRVFAEHRWRG